MPLGGRSRRSALSRCPARAGPVPAAAAARSFRETKPKRAPGDWRAAGGSARGSVLPTRPAPGAVIPRVPLHGRRCRHQDSTGKHRSPGGPILPRAGARSRGGNAAGGGRNHGARGAQLQYLGLCLFLNQGLLEWDSAAETGVSAGRESPETRGRMDTGPGRRTPVREHRELRYGACAPEDTHL